MTKDDLKQMQSLPLESKIVKTKLRIKEWYEYWDGNVYLSFSGGKDSTVLLDLIRQCYPNVSAVFVDTGLEYPEIREFVKTKENVVWLRPKIPFNKVIEKYGYPVISKDVSEKIYQVRKNPDGCRKKCFDSESEYVKKYGKRYDMSKWNWLKDSDIPISSYCCNVMKKDVGKKYKKETGKYPIYATMACESQLRKNSWIKNGCNAFTSTHPSSQPMSFWTEQDVLTYLRNNKIPYASIYGDIVEEKGKLKTTGVDRTGCMFCMYGVHLEKEPNRFQRMKITHPKQYDYCINKLGIGKVLDYIRVKY